MQERVAQQQGLFESAAQGLDDLVGQQWQQASRKPDVGTALHVLGSGAYPSLPRNIFQFGSSAGGAGTLAAAEEEEEEEEEEEGREAYNDEGVRRAEHAMQAQLIREILPAGASARNEHGVLELSDREGSFVAFLTFYPQDGGQWYVIGVELLAPGANAPSRANDPELAVVAKHLNVLLSAARGTPNPLALLYTTLQSFSSVVDAQDLLERAVAEPGTEPAERVVAVGVMVEDSTESEFEVPRRKRPRQ